MMLELNAAQVVDSRLPLGSWSGSGIRFNRQSALRPTIVSPSDSCGRVQSRSYQACGARFSFPGILPFRETDIPPDIIVKTALVPMDGPMVASGSLPMPFAIRRDGPAICLQLGTSRFRITPSEVAVDGPAPLAMFELLFHPVWSVLLSSRGVEALHASTVEREGRALLVAGTQFSGKSTAAYSLLRRGWRLVTDDLAAFDSNLSVECGPPFVRLRERPAGIPTEGPDAGGKHRWFPPAVEQPVPARVIIVLDESFSTPMVLKPLAAVRHLSTHVFNDLLEFSGQRERRLALLADIAENIPVVGGPVRSLSPDTLEAIAADYM